MWESGWSVSDMLTALLIDWTQNVAGSTWAVASGKAPPWDANKVRVIRPGEKKTTEPQDTIDHNALAILEALNETGSKSTKLDESKVTIDPRSVHVTGRGNTTT